MNHNLSCSWRVSSWLLALLLFSPVIALLVEALSPSRELFNHLWETVLLNYISNSIVLIVGVSLLAFILAIPAAWIMSNADIPCKSQLRWLLVMPLAMPSYVIAYIYTDLLEFTGPIQRLLRLVNGWETTDDYFFPKIRSLGGAIIVLALVLYPYLYVLARTAFLEQSKSQLLASRLLGCSLSQSFFRVSLPMARPAVITGLSLIGMETLGDFATVSYFSVPTLTTAVYDTWLGYGSLNAAAKISAMMLLVVVLLVSAEKYSRRKQQLYQKNTGQEQNELVKLSGCMKWLGVGWCWMLVILGFLLPTIILLEYFITYFDDSWSSDLLEYGVNSLMVAGLAAISAGVIALLLGVHQRLIRNNSSKIPSQLASVGYAMPGNILVIGILIPLTIFDNFINECLIFYGQNPVGLILSGSVITLVFAYVVRFSAVSIGSVESSLGRISFSLDMASRSLGCNPRKMVHRVYIPLVSKGMLAGVLLVFIESMKELPATLLLRPFNFETLATRVFQYVSDEQLEYAASSALALVAAGLIPLILLNRPIEKWERK